MTGSFELLRPNLKDVLYQLEVNTFRDGLIAKNDHAGCGMMLARWEIGRNVGGRNLHRMRHDAGEVGWWLKCGGRMSLP